MKIIEAIQERLGPQYATLPDAIGWYSGPQALREDFTGEYYFNTGRRPFNRRLTRKREVLTLNEKILEALAEMTGTQYDSIGAALAQYSRAELLDMWLRYEGLIGYTSQILSVMGELGYDVDEE